MRIVCCAVWLLLVANLLGVGASNPTTFKGNTRTYNSDNQLTTVSMTHDGNGNPTTYGGATFACDVENRVTAIGSALTCGYRADNLRTWKQGSTGGKTYFLYDGGTPIIEMDSSGNVANINVFAPDGLVARKEGSTWTYYTFDQQGNVAQRLNSSQVVQTSRVFDAWGSGAETTTPRSQDCWNYNGKWGYYYDRETSLYYCQNRMYDASTGRWINRDPIGYAGGVNLYSYCAASPVSMVDDQGLEGSGRSRGAEIRSPRMQVEGRIWGEEALEGPNDLLDQAYSNLVNEGAEQAGRQLANRASDEFFNGGRVGNRNNLRDNMIRDGNELEPCEDAAHIVARKHPRAAEARDVLRKHGVHPDQSVNGRAWQRPSHRRSHTHKWFDYVNERLRGIDNVDDLMDALRQLGDEMLGGGFFSG